MQHIWLHKNKKNKLIIFFCGWGQDEKPFSPLGSEDYDVLMFYNYHNFETDSNILEISKEYKSVSLIAWSMGVMVANHLLADNKNLFSKTVAINGSTLPIDDQFGIPVKAYLATYKLFSQKARDAFFKNMNVTEETISLYNKNIPQRTVQDQKDELLSLYDFSKTANKKNVLFEKAIIGKQDQIFPVKNLIRFWKPNAQLIDSPHFVFYKYKKWDDIV